MADTLDINALTAALTTITDPDERENVVAILAKLGIADKIKTKKTTTSTVGKMAKRMLPPEYAVVALHVCLTCGTVIEQYFMMAHDEVRWALVSVPLTEKPKPPYKEIESRTDRCIHCEGVLIGLPKEELISKIFCTIDRLSKLK